MLRSLVAALAAAPGVACLRALLAAAAGTTHTAMKVSNDWRSCSRAGPEVSNWSNQLLIAEKQPIDAPARPAERRALVPASRAPP